MIRTKYDLTLIIDDESYEISVANETPALKKQFKDIFKSEDPSIKKMGKLQDKLSCYQTDFNINLELLKDKETQNRSVLAAEQKELNKKIFDIKEQLEILSEKNKDSLNLDEKIEQHYKKRFDLLVGKEDASRLKSLCIDAGVAFSELFGEIGKLIQEQKEKK